MRTLSGTKRRDCIIKPIAGWRWHDPRAEGIQLDNGRLLNEQRPFARPRGVVTRDDEQGWRATFYTSGVEHSPTSAKGTAWERAPWRAVQRAAWQALN